MVSKNKKIANNKLADQYKFTSHGIDQYGVRFCSSKDSFVKITQMARKDFEKAIRFDKKNIEPYLKKVKYERHEQYGSKRSLRQDFEECFIYKNKVFLSKEKHIVTVVMVSQFIKEKYLPFLNTQVSEFEIKPEIRMI